jgi:hypothetical protein
MDWRLLFADPKVYMILAVGLVILLLVMISMRFCLIPIQWYFDRSVDEETAALLSSDQL